MKKAVLMQIKLHFITTTVTLQDRVELLALDVKIREKQVFSISN